MLRPHLRFPVPYPIWKWLVLRGTDAPIRVDRRRFVLPGLAPELSGLRAVFMSDLHLGPHVPERYLHRVIEQVLALQADIVLLGGDYIDRTCEECRGAARLVSRLTATGVPTIGVLGNHDWWAERGTAAADRGAFLRAVYEGVGLRLLDNQHLVIGADGRVADGPTVKPGLCIAGIGDCREGKVDPEAALRGSPVGIGRLLLAHSPDAVRHHFFKGVEHGVGLMLCGHTHGGQCVLPLLGAPMLLVKERRHGRGVSAGPGFPVLTSNGVGVSSLPVRIGCPPEIHEVTLAAKDA